ncbi:hypothetical protein L1987_82661 [Smallanthus sonchifolius]|uniref:Uncharacterized protein n=1 Tax=Smallanthus sonchifolius TaxID=185202 RepID=A0ACB8YBJ5_9ASTR|nr:hypothetical protein L1987_82661 [Smallanthus sonchifolius]
MMNSTFIFIGIKPQFSLPSNRFPPSPSRCKTDFKSPVISIRKNPNLPLNSAATNGFCPHSPEETLYDLLGISPSGTLPEIKRAYKRMALKYHPDVSMPDQVHENTARFIRVQEAYKTLSDPEARAMYDFWRKACTWRTGWSGGKSRGRCSWKS